MSVEMDVFVDQGSKVSFVKLAARSVDGRDSAV